MSDLTEAEAAALAELEDVARFASEARNQSEIAARLGISRQAVAEMEKRAVTKMRRLLRRRSLGARSDWV